MSLLYIIQVNIITLLPPREEGTSSGGWGGGVWSKGGMEKERKKLKDL